jgi:hypothetical protein
MSKWDSRDPYTNVGTGIIGGFMSIVLFFIIVAVIQEISAVF